MRIKAVLSAILIGTVFTLTASGCNIADLGSDSLLRPPKTMGDEAEIEQLIADTAKEKYTLKYPKNGNYRSAIIMSDLDGDKNDEAIAFFRSGEDITHIHMLVMYNDTNEWKLSSDSVTETTDIDSVDFADIDGTGSFEIIVGYTTYTPNVNILSCYSYSDGKTTEIKSDNKCSSFYCGDFNLDGKQEIMSLLLFSTENEASATMLDYNKEKNILFAKASVPMDPNVVKFKNVAVSAIDGNTNGVIADGSFSNDETNTQIIYYNSELSLLRNPLYKEKTKNVTQRTVPVISRDIDSDGTIEIPAVEKMPYTESAGEKTAADKITWYDFSVQGESLVAKCSMAANYSFGYAVKMSDKWTDGAVTAVCDSKNNSMSFFEWNKNTLGNELFEIRVFDTDEWDNGKSPEEYTLISKDNKYAYTFLNKNTDSRFSLTDDEIKTAFTVLTESAA